MKELVPAFLMHETLEHGQKGPIYLDLSDGGPLTIRPEWSRFPGRPSLIANKSPHRKKRRSWLRRYIDDLEVSKA